MWQHLLRDGDSRGHAGENDLVHDALADAAVTEALPCGGRWKFGRAHKDHKYEVGQKNTAQHPCSPTQ